MNTTKAAFLYRWQEIPCTAPFHFVNLGIGTCKKGDPISFVVAIFQYFFIFVLFTLFFFSPLLALGF